jgi:hypothetical protein
MSRKKKLLKRPHGTQHPQAAPIVRSKPITICIWLKTWPPGSVDPVTEPVDSSRRVCTRTDVKGEHILDEICAYCSGPVTTYGVIDKVWNYLGFGLREWVCVGCLCKGLNMDKTDDPQKITDQIIRHRHRFGLEQVNMLSGEAPVPLHRSFLFFAVADAQLELVAKQGGIFSWQLGRCDRDYGTLEINL